MQVSAEGNLRLDAVAVLVHTVRAVGNLAAKASTKDGDHLSEQWQSSKEAEVWAHVIGSTAEGEPWLLRECLWAFHNVLLIPTSDQ